MKVVETLERVGPTTVAHAYEQWAAYVLEESANFAARREELEKTVANSKASPADDDNDDDVPVEGAAEDDTTMDTAIVEALSQPMQVSATPGTSSLWGGVASSLASLLSWSDVE